MQKWSCVVWGGRFIKGLRVEEEKGVDG